MILVVRELADTDRKAVGSQEYRADGKSPLTLPGLQLC